MLLITIIALATMSITVAVLSCLFAAGGYAKAEEDLELEEQAEYLAEYKAKKGIF